jgi:hypothetical protein
MKKLLNRNAYIHLNEKSASLVTLKKTIYEGRMAIWSTAAVHQKSQLSLIKLHSQNQHSTQPHSSSERAKRAENVEGGPPTSKVPSLSGKCLKL